MSEECFWNTDESFSTAKFAVHEAAMTMRQAGRIFRLEPAPPRGEDINDYIASAVRENDLTYFTYFLHHYESRLNKRVYRFLLTEGIDRTDMTLCVFWITSSAQFLPCWSAFRIMIPTRVQTF